MSVWAIADLHLSFGVPNKGMEVFGEQWKGWTEKVKNNWVNSVNPDDLVLIPGDISWAMTMEQVAPDLNWIHQLPGTKLMLKGNHDYWWSSPSKVRAVLPASMHIIQNDVFRWKDISIGGSRLWDTPEYSFDKYIHSIERAPLEPKQEEAPVDLEKIFQRELARLEMSLQKFTDEDRIRIAMTHYPPIGADLLPSRAAAILEKYRINYCVFGHVHNIPSGTNLFGTKDNIQYNLTACDYLECKPLRIL